MPKRRQVVILVLDIERKTTEIIAELTYGMLEYLLLKIVIDAKAPLKPR